MVRGTTPKLEFSLPFDTATIKEVYVTLAQNNDVIIEKDLNDCTCNGQKLTLQLSQNETLELSPATSVEIQVRVLTLAGEALASEIFVESADRILKDGVI